MKRETINSLILWLLAIVTLVTLLANPPQREAFTEYSQWFAVYGLLTAFALYFSVIMTEAELSPAHVIGIIAFLSLPHSAQNTMTWAIFIGGVAGGLSLLVRSEARRLPRRRLTVKTARGVIVMTARVTLSFYAAGQVYSALGGTLPLEQLSVSANAGTLVAFSVFYVVIYMAIFILELYSESRSLQHVLADNVSALFTVLVLPVPFAVLAAEVFNSQANSQASFVLLSAGLMLIIISLHGLSRAQYQMRQQIDELRSLSVVSQTMGSKLEFDGVMNVVYLQVSELLDIDNFRVAIYREDDKKLHFPIVIRKREQQPTLKPVDIDGRTMMHYVFRTGQPLLIPRDVTARAMSLGLQPPPVPLQSWVGVPLIAGGRTLGVIAVASEQSNRRFDANDLRLLNIVAGNASVAIDNAQFYEAQTQRVEQLVSMNEVLSQLTGTLSPDVVLDRILIAAATISNASGVAVYLYWDEAHSTLALARSAGMSDKFLADPIEPLIKDPLLKLEKARDVASDLPPFVVEDVHTDVRTAYLRTIMVQEHKTAWVELPLGLASEFYGVLVLYYDEARPFSAETVELLRTFATQVAQAINNARIYTRIDEALERRVNQLVSLATAGHELTVTMNLSMIADLVLNHAISATQADRGGLVLRENDNQLTLYAHQGYPEGTFANKAIINQGITGQVFISGTVSLLDKVSIEPQYFPLMPTTRSQLSVPILRGDDTEGVITLESDTTESFKIEDADFVTQLATQAIISVENARLFRRITEARDRLQVILETMREAIVLIDDSGKIALSNWRVQMLGLEASKLQHKDVESLLEETSFDIAESLGFKTDGEMRKLLRDLRWNGRVDLQDPVHFVVRGKLSVLQIQREIFPVYGEEENVIGALFVFYDQTEAYELEQSREELSQMLIHDLRSPLSAVTTSLKLIDELMPPDVALREKISDTTETGRRAIRKLLRRVDSLLDLSRMESGDMKLETEPLDLSLMVENVRSELKFTAVDLNVTLSDDIPADLPKLLADADKIERVLLNLTDNALKYTATDSTILTRMRVSASNGATKRHVRVEVADRGPGIPDVYKDRLFNRFVQVEGQQGRRKGTGLGLAFCRMVIEAHRGSIWVEDRPGGGSIFVFTLPVDDAPDSSSPTEESSQPEQKS